MKNTRAKGNKLEYDVQKWMRQEVDGHPMFFRRVGMSGQLEGLKGDFVWEFGYYQPKYGGKAVEIEKTFQGEAKSGKQCPKKLWQWLEKDKSDFLVLRRDRKPRLWVMTEELLEWLVGQ